LKIAIIGYGKMGKLVEEAALQKGHSIICRIDSKSNFTEIHKNAISHADVCIDFSKPACVLQNIYQVARSGKNLIMGTTGWYDDLDKVKTIISETKIGFLYSPNFSLGINLFLKIVGEAAKLMHPHMNYDVGGLECHHKHKLDSPSGTAKAIASTLVDNLNRPDVKEVNFSSIRCGSIPGTHSVIFDSLNDSITLTHEARNRKSFAEGALVAAEWLQGKQGFYTIDDLWQGE
jgi:4-hydroxy-tetrahydrodipicolinate reductase